MPKKHAPPQRQRQHQHRSQSQQYHNCLIARKFIKTSPNGLPCPCLELGMIMTNGVLTPLQIRTSMPSSDVCLDTNSASTSLALKLRRLYDDRLQCSRKKFNKSRKRVEVLKENQKKIKRVKSIEKPSENSWITSGALGSRDAVLVFRTNILNRCPISESDRDEKSSNDSLNATAKPISESHAIVIRSQSKAKVLSALPKNVSISRNCIASTTTTTTGLLGKSAAVAAMRKLDPLLSPKKRMHDSLSSSDTSISSECDDPLEVEEDIRKSVCAQRSETDLENCLNKSDSFDNKENVSEDCDETSPDTSELPAAKLQILYKFQNTETKLLKKIFSRHGLVEVEGDQNFSILWTGVHMKPDILRNLTPYQRVNHFPRSYELTRKDRLYKNIEKMQHLRGYKHFDIVPQSFVLPLEYRDLVSAHNKCRGPWIVKPAASSRGRGIFIVNSPDQIPPDEQVLVSKYIADPLCIDGHKCDLRVYVLVTSFDPLIIYVYEEGLVRLATVKYDRNAENLWNPCMHLCNYSINKYHSDYIKSSDADDEDVGHKWTLSALLRHLKSQGCDTTQLMANIEELIIKSMFACAQSIIAACRMFVPSGNNCFELYGFDILIDDTLKPWLLEINLSPSMGIDSPLDTKVKASLVTDLLTLVGIPAYSPVMRAHYDSKWTRFRNISCSRRTASADPVGHTSKKGTAVTPPLTTEEMRIVRSVNLQNARRGGFVRVYPAEDSMQKYGSFLDANTGIPLSTAPQQGQSTYSMILPHNFNQMLFNQLYGKDSKGSSGGAGQENTFGERMSQYERALETSTPISFAAKKLEPKCVEEGKRLRKHIRKLLENGSELTQLQSRQAFGLYLEAILRRLTQEPKSYHEKLILKFINRIGGSFKAPIYLKNPLNLKVSSKDRTAMVAKLLGDYLESYNRDTEAYIDAFDNYGMIPISMFNEFLSHAEEGDLESVLTLHTNLTHSMPYLYNRCGASVPQTPPIPTGVYGLLKALPSMVGGGSHARDVSKIEPFYKSSGAAPDRGQKSQSTSVKVTTITAPTTGGGVVGLNRRRTPSVNR